MNSLLMDKIIKNMVDNNLVRSWQEEITEENKIDLAGNLDLSSETNDDDIGISSDGIKYSKRDVMTYLTFKGYQINQSNIDLVAKMLSESDSGFSYTTKTTKRILHHDLEEAEYDDLISYINYKILEEIAKLKNEILKNNIKEYAVEVVYDRASGGCDIETMVKIINRYSDSGWQIKSIFTNELGKNSTAISTSIGSIGTNASIDQTIIIFERAKFFNMNNLIPKSN